MNDETLVDLLIQNYTEQYKVYTSLLDNLSGWVLASSSFDLVKTIPLLEARNRDFDTIRTLDSKIVNEKLEWEARGSTIHIFQAEILRTLLGNIRAILSQVLETNKRLEDKIAEVAKK